MRVLELEQRVGGLETRPSGKYYTDDIEFSTFLKIDMRFGDRERITIACEASNSL